jgi:ABC-type transport system involved in multi-copper enzyme maturation permease subunit
LAWTLAALLIVVWLMRRQDRKVSETGGQQWVLAAEGALRVRTPDLPAGGGKKDELSGVIPEPHTTPALALSPGIAAAPSGWRMITAIAGKDIRDAIRNKLVVSIILGVGVMVASNAFIPRLLNFGDTPSAIVYDEGSSTLLRELYASDDYHLSLRDSREEFEESLSGAINPRLGLEIPANFDHLVSEGQQITLTGYYTHWADLDKIEAEAAFFAETFNVEIDYEGHPVYPAKDAQGQTFLVTDVIVITIGVMGVSLVPLLMVEEKEANTLDALLASPAGHFHIITGKALAGFVYCLLTAALLYLVYQHLIVSHWIALLAILATITFSVAVGLFVGMLSDSPTTTGMWGALLLVGLLGSTVLDAVNQTSWPAWIQSTIIWLPGTLMADLVRFSMAGNVPVGLWLQPLAVLLLQAGVVYLLVVWLLRRRDL